MSERARVHHGLRGLAEQLGPVAAGLVVLGLGSFAFLSIAGRALGPVDFAPVATLWVLFNASALAFFQPIEQELGRATAARFTHGLGARPVLVRCALVGVGVTACLALLVLVLRRTLDEEAFNGQGTLAPLLLLGLVGLLAEHVLRGVFSGNERFGRYGGQLAADGLLRIALPAAVVLVSTATVTSLSAALVVAPLLAAVLTAGRVAALSRPGPPVPWRELLPALGTLTVAAILSQLIVNAAPIAAQVLATPEEADRAGVFIAALVLTRIPLFFFGAVQATFLPALARLSAAGDRHGFLRQTWLVLMLVGGAGAAFVVGLAVVGPWVLSLLYGPEFTADRSVLVLLGLGAAAYMIAQALAQAVIALRSYRTPLYAWAAGSAVFFATLALPLSLETRVSMALLCGGTVAAAVMAVLLSRRLRVGLGTPSRRIHDPRTDRSPAAGDLSCVRALSRSVTPDKFSPTRPPPAAPVLLGDVCASPTPGPCRAPPVPAVVDLLHRAGLPLGSRHPVDGGARRAGPHGLRSRGRARTDLGAGRGPSHRGHRAGRLAGAHAVGSCFLFPKENQPDCPFGGRAGDGRERHHRRGDIPPPTTSTPDYPRCSPTAPWRCT